MDVTEETIFPEPREAPVETDAIEITVDEEVEIEIGDTVDTVEPEESRD